MSSINVEPESERRADSEDPRRKEAWHRAEDLAGQLMRRVDEPEAYTKMFRATVSPIGDVEADVARFGGQYRSWRDAGLDIPCLAGEATQGVPLPLDMGPRFGWEETSQLELTYALRNDARERAEMLRTATGLEYTEYPAGEVREWFGSRLVAFLAVRFGAKRRMGAAGVLDAVTTRLRTAPLGAPGHAGGFSFEVHADVQGLRVHYSPAYWFSPYQVFGWPTSPVRSWIKPGRYVFGAADSGSPPQFDMYAFYDVPPQRKAQLQLR